MIIIKSNDEAKIHQFTDQLEEMHPISFRLAFGLTHEVAAEELGLEPQTMRSYLNRSPSRRVRKLAATIAKRWLTGGRLVVDTKHLVPYQSTLLDIPQRRLSE
jgi:hypothetical protein